MRSRDELLGIMDMVCADVREQAVGAAEVPERLVVVTDSAAEVQHATGTTLYEDGGVIAFVNNSGVPFVEQSDELVAQAAKMNPMAVLLGGTAITGRPGGVFRKILAVQLFSARHSIRIARIALVETDVNGAIGKIGDWREVSAGPRMWAEEILGPQA